jgi:CubicO group peptidase (beta-lactamase class C family)
LISDYHKKGLFDGAVLVADSNGVLYRNAFGLADREKNIPLTTESIFYLASVSKQFTSTAILLLVQQGKISLNDNISQFIPELPGIYRDINFRHLLNHTSGIPDYYEFMEPFDGFKNEDVLDVLISIDSLEFKPGTKYAYSNSGYVLLSILVDKISGLTFSSFLKQNAFDKISLEHTVVFDQYAGNLQNRAVGYGQDERLTDYRFRTTGGGGIFSNVTDLYLWHRGLANQAILDDEYMNLAYQPTVLSNDSIVYYGFGWFLDPEDNQHVAHDGNLEGFRTFFDRRLDNEKVIILLSNNSSRKIQEISSKIWKFW